MCKTNLKHESKQESGICAAQMRASGLQDFRAVLTFSATVCSNIADSAVIIAAMTAAAAALHMT